MGNFDQAKNTLELLINSRFKLEVSYWSNIYNIYALILNNFEEYERAKVYFEKAIKLNPKFVFIILNYASLLSNNYFKKYDIARKYLTEALALNPKLAIVYLNYANLLILDYFKEYNLAEEYYLKAIEINGKDYAVYHNLAILNFEYLKDKDKAFYYFAKAIEINKDPIFTRKELAKRIENIPFITNIDIQKLRHISNIQIEIDKSSKKNIILTGINGSGKTTVLNECKNFLLKVLETPIDQLFTEKSRAEIFEPKEYTLRLNFNPERLTDLRLAYESGIYVVKYLGANTGENGNRSLNPLGVEKIEKVQLPLINKIEENLADKIVAYLVDLDYTRLRAYRNKEEKIYTEIDNWFDNFLKILQSFDEQIIELKYSDTENQHNFILKVNHPTNKGEIIDVKFNELPDGFKAVFKIVFEIILQMQNKVQTTYDIPGIVMIDEPELFLHIKMQKKIMPALTSLFPNIQFIVATHSPYVLNSISNTVIFDLQTHQRLVDVSEIPVNKLSENYFSFSPEYVESVKSKVEEFVELIKIYIEKKLTKTSKKRLAELEIELDEVTPYISDEYFKIFKENQKYLYE